MKSIIKLISQEKEWPPEIRLLIKQFSSPS
jgi:hypothetical protein